MSHLETGRKDLGECPHSQKSPFFDEYQILIRKMAENDYFWILGVDPVSAD